MIQEQLIETVLLRLADGLPHSLADINADDLAYALQQLDAWGLQPSQDEYSRYSIVRRLNLLDQAAINRTLFQHKLQNTQQDTQQGSVLVSRSLDSTNEFLLTQKDLPSGTVLTMEDIGGINVIEKSVKGHIVKVEDYTIPTSDVVHRLVIVEKVSPTPRAYPRAFAKIKKAPL